MMQDIVYWVADWQSTSVQEILQDGVSAFRHMHDPNFSSSNIDDAVMRVKENNSIMDEPTLVAGVKNGEGDIDFIKILGSWDGNVSKYLNADKVIDKMDFLGDAPDTEILEATL